MPNPTQNPNQGQFDPKKGQQGQADQKKVQQNRDDENQSDSVNRDKKPGSNY